MRFKQAFMPGSDENADALFARTLKAQRPKPACAEELGAVSPSRANVVCDQAVALASFISPTGLKKVGSANWESTGLSGPASYGSPGSGAYGSLLSGALERSNVDIAEELVGLITAQRNFQANAKAIDTATQISQTVINLRT